MIINIEQNIIKKCFKCNSIKPKTEFYKHKQMSDGLLGKCKECTKKDAQLIQIRKTSTIDGLEAERERCRSKYKRLNYKEKQSEWDKNKPWKKTNVYKNLSRKYKTEKGIEIHHWNYNELYLENFFLLDVKNHKKAHKYLILNLEQRIFFGTNSEILNTKEKHYNYLLSKGIVFTNQNS